MRAYLFDMSFNADTKNTVIGKIAESEDAAYTDIHRMYNHLLGDKHLPLTSITTVSLRPATLKQYRRRELPKEFRGHAAICGGYLFYVAGTVSYAARCGVRRIPGGGIECLIYQDTHSVVFDNEEVPARG